VKVSICDICKYENGKAAYAGWKLSIKRGAERIGLDACDKHKDFMKGKKYEDVQKWLEEQIRKTQPRIDLLFKEGNERK